jgi:hypothetical protein
MMGIESATPNHVKAVFSRSTSGSLAKIVQSQVLKQFTLFLVGYAIPAVSVLHRDQGVTTIGSASLQAASSLAEWPNASPVFFAPNHHAAVRGPEGDKGALLAPNGPRKFRVGIVRF